MTEYSDITFNSVTLRVTSITPTRKQKSRKIILGKSMKEVNVIGLAAQQWDLSVSGVVLGTTSSNLSTNRASIEALDVVTPYAYTDGIHNGTYLLVPGSLKFSDKGTDVGMYYNYSFRLVEE